MSRTYRRKEMKPVCVYGENECSRFCSSDELRWTGVYGSGMTYEQYRKKAVAMFHADGGHHYWKAPLPRWVRNMFQERPFRRETRLMIKKSLLMGTVDDMSIKRPKKDSWLFW